MTRLHLTAETTYTRFVDVAMELCRRGNVGQNSWSVRPSGGGGGRMRATKREAFYSFDLRMGVCIYKRVFARLDGRP